MRHLTISAQSLCTHLVVELFGRLFEDSDPEYPPIKPFQVEEVYLPFFREIWRRLGASSFVTGGVSPCTLVLPDRNEVILWLGDLYMRMRHAEYEGLVVLLYRAFGQPDAQEVPWERYVELFRALQGENRDLLLKQVRVLALLDAIILIVMRMMKEEPKLNLSAPPSNPKLWSGLAALTVDAGKFLQGWCKMLDVRYRSGDGAAFARINDYIETLRSPK